MSSREESDKKLLADFKARQAQTQKTALTRAGIDPNERLRLARANQKKTDELRRQTKSESARQVLVAQQQARESKALAQKIAQQKRSAQDRGFVQTTTGSGRSVNVSQTTAIKLAERIRASEQKKVIQTQQQSQQTVKQVEFKPTRTKRQTDLGKTNIIPTLGTELSKVTIRGGKTPQPNFLGGSAKEFLTKDRQSSFSLFPSIPEARAEEFPVSQNIQRSGLVQQTVQKPVAVKQFGQGQSFATAIPNPNAGKIISVEKNPDGSITTSREPQFLSFTGKSGISQENRPPVSKNFIEGFFAGSRQEAVNFGNIVDIATGKGGVDEFGNPLKGTFGTTRKEAGSSIIDLPFAVGESLLFDEEGTFDFSFERASKRSGEEQDFIRSEFERDPARAIGSTVTAIGTEVALIIGTAGVATVARKGIVKTAQFVAKSKAHKQAVQIAKATTPKGEESVPFIVEQTGKNTFEVIRGVEALGKKGVRVFKGTDQGFVRGIGAKGEVVLTKIPKIFGVGRGTKFTKAGSKQKLDPKNTVISSFSNDSKIPLTIIKIGKNADTTFFPKKIPKKTGLQTRGTIILEGVTGEEITASRRIGKQVATGLKPFERKERIAVTKTLQPDSKTVVGQFDNVGRSFTTEGVEIGSKNAEDTLRLIGKPTKATAKQLDQLEDTGFIQTSARGFSFKTADVKNQGKIISEIVQTGKTGKQSLPKSVGEFKQAKAFERVQPTDVRVTTFEIFSTKAEGSVAKIKGLPKVGKERQFVKEKPFNFGVTGTRVISNTGKGKGASRTGTKVKPDQDFLKIRQTFGDIGRAKSKVKGGRVKTKPPRDSISSISSLGIKSSIVTGSIVGRRQGLGSSQVQKQGVDSIFGTTPKVDTGLISDVKTKQDREILVFPPRTGGGTKGGQRLDSPLIITPITSTTTTTPIITTTVTKTPVTTTVFPPIGATGVPFGLPRIDRKIRGGKRKRSKTGKRLFDVADTPFGKVEVGLGFFIEQEGEESIAEAIGTAPKNGKKKKKQAPIDNIFDPSGLF